jgi:4-hydroxybenzoate polyprenyltransferase
VNIVIQKIHFFLKLIRWPNLLIIVLTMYLLRYCLLLPLLVSYGLSSQLSNFIFFLLVLSTLLLAAAGYIINDLYDVDSDKINKPSKVIISNIFSSKFAENLNLVLNAIAIGIGIYISFKIGIRSVSMAFMLVAGLLYFYSSSYKGYLLFGNLIVCFFAALVPIMVLLFELPLLKVHYESFLTETFNFNFLIAWFGFYSLFAFLISLLRELIKDMEDFEGDSAYGQKTLPVTIGIKSSKIVSTFIILVTIVLIIYILSKYLYDPISCAYIISFVIMPLVYIGWILWFASEKKSYTIASAVCKMVMLTGILYSLLVRFVLFK